MTLVAWRTARELLELTLNIFEAPALSGFVAPGEARGRLRYRRRLVTTNAAAC